MAGQLAYRKWPFTLLEASDKVGVAWRNHYDRLHLHTVKEHSALPFLPFPADYPTYVSRAELVTYLEQYAHHFGIQPRFNQVVTSIERTRYGGTQPGRWTVQTTTDTFIADQLVVATGYNRVPNEPQLPGLSTFKGDVIHSRTYRNGDPFRGKQVLVVGMGNTGAELALDLYEHGAEATISVRGPISIVRRDVLGKPTQPTAIFLNKFPNWFYDLVAGISQQLTVGDLSAYGLGKPKYPPSRLIREFGRIPVIDLGTLDQIKAGNIAVAPGIRQINEHLVTFTDGSQRPFDAIVLATGYRPALYELLEPELAARVLNERGYPTALWYDQPGLSGLYFLGFSTPLTGILRSLNINSGLIADHLTRQSTVPHVL
ncbi:flavin-containing monooxygenase FMO [Fibrella aestuarina BUZ 2]|uniref:Flavin-containing monooxygenase FMO n=2 Tax=Fibrella TaxID=861914 RepID=I0K452_9BACT|nr:flavin-containing monooxygenase FMO [Fibrella aestuarina BUZ 2]